ncbi:MAG: hypothetical protein CMO50_01320 [Verrucomicrobiales bacterium]|nr:hypothetical protein [Verrucomicrobiales bacterium]
MNRGCLKTIVIFSSTLFLLTITFYLAIWPQLKIKIIRSSLISVRAALHSYNNDYPNNPIIENNPENTSKLLGKNGRKKKYLAPKNTIIKKGILVDYWDAPLIYKYSSKEIEVFSSGKNKKPDDLDDIHIKQF